MPKNAMYFTSYKYCPKCGKFISREWAEFCPHCGFFIENPDVPRPLRKQGQQ